MPIIRFPDPQTAHESGVLAQGGDLHPESLLLAYRQGIFPWPMYDEEAGTTLLLWFSPPDRAVLNFADLHISKSLMKRWKHAEPTPLNCPEEEFPQLSETIRYAFSVNQKFAKVIDYCAHITRAHTPDAQPEGPPESRTWITDELRAAYLRMHALGFAHSIEVWERTETGQVVLAGGLYGTLIDGVFAGESMFHLRDDASKLAVLFVMHHLHQKGLDWIDIQVLTPHMEALGAKLLPREEFLKKLKETQKRNQRYKIII